MQPATSMFPGLVNVWKCINPHCPSRTHSYCPKCGNSMERSLGKPYNWECINLECIDIPKNLTQENVKDVVEKLSKSIFRNLMSQYNAKVEDRCSDCGHRKNTEDKLCSRCGGKYFIDADTMLEKLWELVIFYQTPGVATEHSKRPPSSAPYCPTCSCLMRPKTSKFPNDVWECVNSSCPDKETKAPPICPACNKAKNLIYAMLEELQSLSSKKAVGFNIKANDIFPPDKPHPRFHIVKDDIGGYALDTPKEQLHVTYVKTLPDLTSLEVLYELWTGNKLDMSVYEVSSIGFNSFISRLGALLDGE